MRHFIVRNSMSVNQALAGYHPRNRLRVLKSKCLTLYGVESSFFKPVLLNSVQTIWNKVVRACVNVPFNSKTTFLSDVTCLDPLDIMASQRILKLCNVY